MNVKKYLEKLKNRDLTIEFIVLGFVILSDALFFSVLLNGFSMYLNYILSLNYLTMTDFIFENTLKIVY